MKGLEKKIIDKSARVGVVGLGYVGLPLALEFARAGFSTTGIEVDPERVDSVSRGVSYLTDVDDGDLRAALDASRRDLSAGVYFYQLSVDGRIEGREKLVLLR